LFVGMAEQGPSARGTTIRSEIERHLRLGWFSARQLSSLVGISEKAVPGHLEHVEKSARGAGEVFDVEAPACAACDYVFDERGRFTKPSRCPRCKAERVSAPRFRLRAR
jgi:hypothetical protein